MTGRWAVVVLVVTTSAVVPSAAGAALAENESLLADAGLDQQAERGESILLDATGSRDPDGEIVSFEWRIETPNGDVVRPGCTDCPRSRFTADQAGRYAVTVTVIDDDGATSTDTLFVDVETANGEPSEGDRDEAEAPTLSSPDYSGGGSVSTSSAGCSGDCTTEPWIEIHGPASVGTEEEVSFNVEYGGFSSEPQIGWSISGHGETASETWNSPGDVTIYATGATDSEFARDAHKVEVVENMEPEVSIGIPDNMRPGETVTLMADASDEDGRVVSVEWQNGPVVQIPKDAGRKMVSVTVTDDDDAEATSSYVVTSEGIKSNDITETKVIHTVYCYYNKEPGRTRQSPDHCEISNSDTSSDSDGHQSDTSNVQRMLQSPNYDVIWKKTEQDVNQHSGNLGNEVGTRMPDVVDNDGTSPSVPSLDSSQRNVLRGESVETREESFTLDGDTVTNDLTGDGEINSEDWDERFGSDSSGSSGNHEQAVGEVKKSQRADRQATGSGGPATSDSGTDAERASIPDWHGGTDNSSRSTSANDHVGTSTTSGEVAAEKGEKLASGGMSSMGLF